MNKSLSLAKSRFLAVNPNVSNINDVEYFVSYAIECVLANEELDGDAILNAGVSKERLEYFEDVFSYIKVCISQMKERQDQVIP